MAGANFEAGARKEGLCQWAVTLVRPIMFMRMAMLLIMYDMIGSHLSNPLVMGVSIEIWGSEVDILGHLVS